MMTGFDELAWRSIHEPTPHASDNKGLEQSGRPKNYEEVAQLMERGGDWELVIADFLHEFNFFRTADFFEKEPGEWFSCEMRTCFAGHDGVSFAIVSIRQFRSGLEKPEISWRSLGRIRTTIPEPEFRRRNMASRNLARL